jgi:hypothetical protein
LTVLDHVLADSGHGLLEVELRLVLAQGLADDLGDLHVEALDLAGRGILQAEQRLVELDAHDEFVRLAQAIEPATGRGIGARLPGRGTTGGGSAGGRGARRRCARRGGARRGGAPSSGRRRARVAVVTATGGQDERARDR